MERRDHARCVLHELSAHKTILPNVLETPLDCSYFLVKVIKSLAKPRVLGHAQNIYTSFLEGINNNEYVLQ